LAARLAADADRGDSAAVARIVAQYRADSENRFRNIDADIQSAGNSLLQSGKSKAALTVFTVDVALFPRSSTGFLGLGSALEREGQRDAAIRAYRQSLVLNANMFPARDALQRLGVP
jgi:Flp pilus assembly protein TadD